MKRAALKAKKAVLKAKKEGTEEKGEEREFEHGGEGLERLPPCLSFVLHCGTKKLPNE